MRRTQTFFIDDHHLSRLDVDRFHGIEVDEFPAMIAVVPWHGEGGWIHSPIGQGMELCGSACGVTKPQGPGGWWISLPPAGSGRRNPDRSAAGVRAG